MQIVSSKNVTLGTTCERLAAQYHLFFFTRAGDIYGTYTNIPPLADPGYGG